jgi:hypothetical protein
MLPTNEHFAVRVDEEYAAECWWNALRERYPSFARLLERDGFSVITVPFWEKITSLPGFSGGPKYAPTALISEGE